MKRLWFIFCAVILLVGSESAFAAQPAYEFHHDARMQLQTGVEIDNAYGYVYVATDMKGHGVIQVMFSNGTRLDYARFNAQVNFLDADGALIHQERFSHRIEAAGVDGAAERRYSKLVELNEFATLKIELYLDEVPGINESASATNPAYLRTIYSSN
jgi:hypothetical protein